MTNVMLLSLLLISVGWPQQAHANPVVLQGGMVWSANGDPAQTADVLIVDEHIAAIGQNLPVPPNAQVIDVDGRLKLRHVHTRFGEPLFITPRNVLCWPRLGPRQKYWPRPKSPV